MKFSRKQLKEAVRKVVKEQFDRTGGGDYGKEMLEDQIRNMLADPTQRGADIADQINIDLIADILYNGETRRVRPEEIEHWQEWARLERDELANMMGNTGIQ